MCKSLVPPWRLQTRPSCRSTGKRSRTPGPCAPVSGGCPCVCAPLCRPVFLCVPLCSPVFPCIPLYTCVFLCEPLCTPVFHCPVILSQGVPDKSEGVRGLRVPAGVRREGATHHPGAGRRAQSGAARG